MQLKVIQKKIYEIRGQKVMLDFDLAELYEVATKVLNQAVKRNIKRFPDDFMFQITTKEWETNRSQFVTSSNLGTLSKMEIGLLNISIYNAFKIAKALNVELKDIFDFKV